MHSTPTTLVLMLAAFTFALGCPADDDDAADDDAADDDGGDDDGGDDDSGVSAFAGNYDGGFIGNAYGLFDATVSDEGVLELSGQTTTGEPITGAGTVEDDGAADITVDGTGRTGKVQFDFAGDFRIEGDDRFGYGPWTSSDGGAGHWGAWPPDFDHGVAPADIELACSNSTTHCGNPAMTPDECHAVTHCQSGFIAAKSSDCLTVYLDLIQIFIDMDGPEDCPDLKQPPPGWVENECPDIFPVCDPDML